jgi:hypothetical protein
LQAHLPVIEGKSRSGSLTLRNAKQRVTSVLKKWIMAARAHLREQSKSLLSFVRENLAVTVVEFNRK